MIKNIVFDMGMVLIRFDRQVFLDHAGVTDPDDRELLLREVFLSLEWSRMDRGSLTDAEAAEMIEENALDSGALTGMVTKLLSDGSAERRADMSRRIADFAVRDANKLIYKEVKRLIEAKK